MDQVILLTQNIEDFFEAKKKAGVIFVNDSGICYCLALVALPASC